MIEDDELQRRIAQIQEMGFDPKDALSALELNNYNINDAVDYLFMDHSAQVAHREAKDREAANLRQLAVEAEKAPPLAPPSQGHVNIPSGLLDNIQLPPMAYNPAGPREEQTMSMGPSAPSFPPPLPSRMSSSQHIENVSPHYTSPAYSQTYAPPPQRQIPHQEPYSIYEDVERYERKDEAPSVLMPLRNGQYEGYLNALLTMLYELPKFRKMIYQHGFETLGFHPRWFKGEDISIPPTASIVEDGQGNEHDLRFLLEIQRLFGFLSGESQRAFASSKNFIKSFPRQAQQKMGEVESLNDAYDVFYHSLVEELKLVGVEHGAIEFFESVFKYKDGDQEEETASKTGMLTIDSDDWTGTFHKSMTSLMSQQQHNDAIAYVDKLSDLWTVAIDPVAGSFMADIELEEYIYPQIYTEEFFEISNEVKLKGKAAMDELTKNSQKLMNLKQHQGKQVLPALDSTIDFIQHQVNGTFLKEKDVTLDTTLELLLKVKDESQKLREQLMQRNEELSEDLRKYSVNNVDTLLELYGKECEPYLLIGVIFDQDKFAYLKKVQGELVWVSVEHESRSATNYKIRPIEFEDLSATVKLMSHNSPKFETPLVMVYVRKSLLEETLGDGDMEIPKSVMDFIKRDAEELQKALELLESDTEPELLEYDEDAIHLEEGDGAVRLDDDDDEYDEIETLSKEVSDDDDSSVDLIDMDTPTVEKSGEANSADSEMSVNAYRQDLGSLDDNWSAGIAAGSPMSIEEDAKIPMNFSPTMSLENIQESKEETKKDA